MVLDKKIVSTAISEINEICSKYGIVLIGTCASEEIFGEITIAPNQVDEKGKLAGWEAAPLISLRPNVIHRIFPTDGSLYVDCIGEIIPWENKNET